jgi:hypothetical protein
MSSKLKIGDWITFIPECAGKQMELFAPRKKGKIIGFTRDSKLIVEVKEQKCFADPNDAEPDKNGNVKEIIDDL